MKKISSLFIFIVLTLCYYSVVLAFDRMPPVVTATYPASGSTDINEEIIDLKVTFSKKMTDQSWSFIKIDNQSFPEMIGEPSFDKTGKVCTLKFRLKPNYFYQIGINSLKHMGFRDSNNQPAMPYLIYFKTSNSLQSQ